MPAHLKPSGQRGGNAKRGALRVLGGPGDAALVPPMPAGSFLKPTKDLWAAYWRSGVAELVEPDIDRGVLERWVWSLDELERARRAFRKQRFVLGSTGQMVLSPAWKQINDLTAEIRRLEQQLGIGPLNRMRLGVATGDAMQSLADLWDDDDSDVEVTVVGAETIDVDAREMGS